MNIKLFVKAVLLICMVAVIYMPCANAQSEGDYRSINDGVWTTASIWQVYENGSWGTANAAPGNDATVTITHSISLEAGAWFGFIPGQDLAFSGEMTIGQGGALTRGNYSTFSIVAGGEVNVLEGGTIDIASPQPDSGYGELSNGGTLNVEGGTVECDDFTGDGTITMTEGDLQVNGEFSPDPGAEVVISGGTVTNDDITVAAGEALSPAGDGAVGTVTVDGNVTFESGSMYKVDVSGGTNSDSLDVGGTLTLGGAELALSGAIGGDLLLASADTLIGEFNGYTNGFQVQQSPAYYIYYVTNESPNRVEIKDAPPPTSSGIDLRAFNSSEGVVVEFVAYDVEADGSIMLILMGQDGQPLWQGTVDVKTAPRVFSRFIVPGLKYGKLYNFKVRDEVGKWWDAPGVGVRPFATEMVSASLEGIELAFDSLPEHEYEIQWVPGLGNPWQTVTNVTASSTHTAVVVPHPNQDGPTGFFKILLK